MLNGDDNENSSLIEKSSLIDLISKKKKLHVQHTFSSN